VSFAREGFVFIALAALAAAAMYAAALGRRSWALWLVAFALTIVALGVAYVFRGPLRVAPGDRPLVVASPILTFNQEGAQVQQGRTGLIL
jgi:hypothetical protein